MKDKIQKEQCLDRSLCPITNTLDIIGDKWTLLVIRDMFFLDKTKFGEFLQSKEGISTNILTDRLKKLEEFGIINKCTYQNNPVRFSYQLTARGNALRPVIMEIIKWGVENIEGVYVPDQ